MPHSRGLAGSDHELVDVLKLASRIVEEADLDPGFGPAAFSCVFRVLVGGSDGLTTGGNHPKASSMGVGSQFTNATTSETMDGAARIASRAGLEVERAKDIYRVDGDEVSLVMGSKGLDKSPAKATRAIALLVVGGRQAAGSEEWTSLSVVREACEQYGRLDAKNYAATVKKMGDVFSFSGSGARTEVRMSVPGWESWQALLQDLVAG